MKELAYADVDGELLEVNAFFCPRSERFKRLFQNVGAQFDDEPGLLRNRDELVRRDRAQGVILPTRQDLASDHFLFRIELGLVKKRDLIVLQGEVELAFDLKMRFDPFGKCIIEDDDTVAPLRFDLIHGDVRLFD